MPTIKLSASGNVILKNGKPSCDCCGGEWSICADNTNEVLDNSWDIYINNNFVGSYSGNIYEYICNNINQSYLNTSGSNEIKFLRTNCVSDDYFEFFVTDPDGNTVYSSYLTGGLCEEGFPSISTHTFYFNLPFVP